jgi:hypothetical protein
VTQISASPRQQIEGWLARTRLFAECKNLSSPIVRTALRDILAGVVTKGDNLHP